MTVHKKHPADAKAMAGREEEKPKEEIIVSDVVTQTTEKIGVIEEVPPTKSPSSDPLSDFKEKMVKEEMSVSDGSQKKNYMWPILFIFIIAILLLAGVFLYKNQTNTNNKINVVTLTPSPAVTTEPTKTVDLTRYEIKILNGSGVEGEASRQKTNLEAEGFMVSTVGNADNSDYTDTIIKAKKEVEKGFLDKLNTVLENTFTPGEVQTLSDEASTPVVVILGTKK